MSGLHPSMRVVQRGARAFTLLEILVTLALIAILSALVVGGATALVRDRPATVEEVLRSVIDKTRLRAVQHFEEIRLSYDAQDRAFVATAPDGTWKTPVTIPGKVEFSFLPASQGSLVLLGGDIVETYGMPYVTFYRDGGCSPFRAQIKMGTDAQVITFDPWTCAPLPESK